MTRGDQLTTEEHFETFIVGAYGTTSDAEYHRHLMNPAEQEAWKKGLRAVARRVRAKLRKHR
jgi:hypothetical protein